MFRRQIILLCTILFMIGLGKHMPSKSSILEANQSENHFKSDSGQKDKLIFRNFNEKIEEKEEEDNHEDQQDLFITPTQLSEFIFESSPLQTASPKNQIQGSFKNICKIYILVRNIRI